MVFKPLFNARNFQVQVTPNWNTEKEWYMNYNFICCSYNLFSGQREINLSIRVSFLLGF